MVGDADAGKSELLIRFAVGSFTDHFRFDHIVRMTLSLKITSQQLKSISYVIHKLLT